MSITITHEQLWNHLHRRQYIISSKPILYYRNWRSVELSPSVHLSHCPALPVQSVSDADGEVWHLIGVAVQTDPNKQEPVCEIAKTKTDRVSALYYSWSGRWTLIGRGELHMDACGSLSCYYVNSEARLDVGGLLISSSPSLLHELVGDRAGARDPRKLVWGHGIEWFPPPRSPFENIVRLLPSQVLSLEMCEVAPRSLFRNVFKGLLYNQVLERIEQALLTFVRRMPQEGRTVWLALSAGKDSRLLLAVMCRSKIPFRTFTLASKSMGLGDRFLPPRLAELSESDHVFMQPGRFCRDRAALYDRHSLGTYPGNARLYFARDQWRFTKAGDVVLRGNCFEVGKCYYWRKLPDKPNVDHLLTGLGEQAHSSARTGIQEWLEWALKTPHVGLDWRDRLYLEQRLGGWLSTAMLVCDLEPVMELLPANCSDIYELMLAVPLEKRLSGEYMIQLINRITPDLLKFPVSPKADYFHPLTKVYWKWRRDSLYPFKYPFRWLKRKTNACFKRWFKRSS